MSAGNSLGKKDFSPSIVQEKTLIDISRQLNSNYSDIGTLQFLILESAMCLVRSCSASFYIADDSFENVRLELSIGEKTAEVEEVLSGKKAVADYVLKNNRAVIVKDIVKDSFFFNNFNDKSFSRLKSIISLPLKNKGRCIAVIELSDKRSEKAFDAKDLKSLASFLSIAETAYFNALSYKNVKEQLAVLSNKIINGESYHAFIAKSDTVKDLLRVIDEVADTNTTVLITGESGVGKSLFAEQIHLKSPKSGAPFIRVNTASLSAVLNADNASPQVKEIFFNFSSDAAKSSGTVFFDEISLLTLEQQEKLASFLKENKTDSRLRIIAATDKSLENLVREELFSADLYYRLNIVPLNIPPLRERKADIEALAAFFLNKFSLESKKHFEDFSQNARKVLLSYFWPGNVRELKNAVERACIKATSPLIQAEDLGLSVTLQIFSEKNKRNHDSDFINFAEEAYEDEDKSLKTALKKFKAAYIKKILKENNWNQSAAARILEIQRTYVCRLLNELHLR